MAGFKQHSEPHKRCIFQSHQFKNSVCLSWWSCLNAYIHDKLRLLFGRACVRFLLTSWSEQEYRRLSATKKWVLWTYISTSDQKPDLFHVTILLLWCNDLISHYWSITVSISLYNRIWVASWVSRCVKCLNNIFAKTYTKGYVVKLSSQQTVVLFQVITFEPKFWIFQCA